MHSFHKYYRRIQWKYSWHRLSAKTPITLWSKNSANQFCTDTTALVQERSFQIINEQHNYIANSGVPKHPLISGPSTWVTFDENKHCTIELQNCAPHEVNIESGDMSGIIDTETTTPIPLDDDSLATICDQIYQRLPKVKKKTWTRNEIEKRCHLGAPEEYRAHYIDTLFRHQAAVGVDKYDLGLAKDFSHRIHLKDDKLIYRKQFNLPEAHNRFIDQTLDEWLKLGVISKTRSPYNSPIFCVPKKTRPISQNRTRLPASEPTLAFRQILHVGN